EVCWGANTYGEIGDNTTTQRSAPVVVGAGTPLNNIADINAGGLYHSCARLNDGTLRCWGYNVDGEMGDNTTTERDVPMAVTGISTAVGIRAGRYSTCALLMNGGMACWGDNFYGQLGDGTTTERHVPTAVMF